MSSSRLNPEEVGSSAVEELKRRLAQVTAECNAAHLAVARAEAREGQLSRDFGTLREQYSIVSNKYIAAKVRGQARSPVVPFGAAG